jgi:hypothetical protein
VILVTAGCVLPLRLNPIRDAGQWPCTARLAKGLSWNNPARGELLELAEEFQRQAEELDVTAGAEQRSMR